MTVQVPDSITVDGRRWVIDEWDGERDCIPANESLGFRTVSPATNNWHDRLLLFKVELSLHPDDKGILPFGSRREIGFGPRSGPVLPTDASRT